jgi:aspartyl-tRNA(Asn)/glutamyl-tRNA(Gln) amidotransferase subunit A
MSDLHWMTASDAARAIAARELSSVELTEALLDRIGRLEPSLHAFVRVDAQGALEAARVADAEANKGRLRGSLHGVPVGIKDIIDVAGLTTTCHSRILADNVASTDATCVQRLRDAGAIVVGKLSTWEFAVAGPSFDLPWPPARNPWNRDHHPGGSSSGSGAAVAAGLVPMALGTDTGGSVRHPAGVCGIVGLKPTYGLVSRRGVFPVSWTLDCVGPMSRTVTDCALMLDAIAGHDPLDCGSAERSRTGSYSVDLSRGVRGLRIGFVRHFHEVDAPADAEVTAALENVIRALAAEGAVVSNVTLPPLNEMISVARVINFSDYWAIHAKRLSERPGDYGRLARRQLMAGAFVTAGDLVKANCIRPSMIGAVERVLREVDVLVCANVMDPPCRIDEPSELERTGARRAQAPFNLTGHPALAMMSGLSRTGLPLSVQFVGRYFEEATLFQVARTWERLAGMDATHAPIEPMHDAPTN